MCPLPSLGLEPEGVRNCERSLASGRFVVQCATNDKISSVWPFINICGFSVLGRDRKLRSAQRKACAGRVDARPTCDAFMERVHPPDDVTFEPDTIGESSSATGAPGKTNIERSGGRSCRRGFQKRSASSLAIKAADTLLLTIPNLIAREFFHQHVGFSSECPRGFAADAPAGASWAWTTTPTCSKASSNTSLRDSAGAERKLC